MEYVVDVQSLLTPEEIEFLEKYGSQKFPPQSWGEREQARVGEKLYMGFVVHQIRAVVDDYGLEAVNRISALPETERYFKNLSNHDRLMNATYGGIYAYYAARLGPLEDKHNSII